MVLSVRSCDRYHCLEVMEMGHRTAFSLPLPGALYNCVDKGAFQRDSFPATGRGEYGEGRSNRSL